MQLERQQLEGVDEIAEDHLTSLTILMSQFTNCFILEGHIDSRLHVHKPWNSGW